MENLKQMTSFVMCKNRCRRAMLAMYLGESTVLCDVSYDCDNWSPTVSEI